MEKQNGQTRPASCRQAITVFRQPHAFPALRRPRPPRPEMRHLQSSPARGNRKRVPPLGRSCKHRVLFQASQPLLRLSPCGRHRPRPSAPSRASRRRRTRPRTVDSASISGNTILRAMRIFAHITEDGQWLEPPKVSIVEHRHSFANSPSPHALAVTRVEELASPAPPLSPAPAGALLVYPACPACPEQSRRERGRRDVGRAASGEKQAGSNGELSSVGQRPKLPSSPQNDQPAPRDSSPLGEILIGTGNASRGEPND